MSKEMVRVKKVEEPSGTYYIPQTRRWKTRWFGRSGYEWEYFKIQETYYGELSFIHRSTTTTDQVIFMVTNSKEKRDYSWQSIIVKSMYEFTIMMKW